MSDTEEVPSNDTENETPEQETEKVCVKLPIAENFISALDKKIEVHRECETLDCDKEILEKIFNNYIIVKNILKYLPWQDKFVCRDVCSLWRSTVLALGKEQLRQVDFSINLAMNAVKNGIVFKKSSDFLNLPMCVLVFCNADAICDHGTAKCLALLPHPCTPPCEKEHSLLDMIHRETSGPNPIMFITKAYKIGYLPLQRSLTYDNAIVNLGPDRFAFYCGFVIPLIKDVEFTTYSTQTAREHTEELKKDLLKTAEENVIKAIIVNVTDHYMLYCGRRSSFMDCFPDIQPDTPYAIGGCLVEDTFAYQEDMDDIIALANDEIDRIICKQVSIAIFAVPKDVEVKPSFEVFSSIFDKTVWTKIQIQAKCREFSKSIPHYENSVALKMSCAGRQTRHDYEQHYFREFFPDTPIAGAFGNGEFGVNHPALKPSDSAKKPKTEFKMYHSYSTVFMYFGWGKIVKPAEIDI